MKFYRCEHCGNIIDFMEDAGVPISCCGERSEEHTSELQSQR